MVKCSASLVTEVAFSSMGLDRVGCSKGVQLFNGWIWVVFSRFGRFQRFGSGWVFSGLGLFKDLDQDGVSDIAF